MSSQGNVGDRTVPQHEVGGAVVVHDVPPIRFIRKRRSSKKKSGNVVGTLTENGPLVDACALTDAELDEARRMAGLTVHIVRPETGSLASSCPSGFFAVHLDAMDHGFRFPLHPFFVEYLNWVGLLPCQVTPNGFYLMTAFLLRCKDSGLEASVGLFRHLFQIGLNSSLENQGYALISQRSFRSGFYHTPLSHHGWKHRFVFICTDMKGGSPFTAPRSLSFNMHDADGLGEFADDVGTYVGYGDLDITTFLPEEKLKDLGFVFYTEFPDEDQGADVGAKPQGEDQVGAQEEADIAAAIGASLATGHASGDGPTASDVLGPQSSSEERAFAHMSPHGPESSEDEEPALERKRRSGEASAPGAASSTGAADHAKVEVEPIKKMVDPAKVEVEPAKKMADPAKVDFASTGQPAVASPGMFPRDYKLVLRSACCVPSLLFIVLFLPLQAVPACLTSLTAFRRVGGKPSPRLVLSMLSVHPVFPHPLPRA
ncbi:unnamed protein product [Cuscuta europaea]|uniref:Transposase (putative) gypsy type domain-containing protein n=1 Tax=Cuscuta europaea TaxID=41803 RepID=A0A9P0VVY8_CUSEU|nr:unnamed protein product [Cuscuta europaea]